MKYKNIVIASLFALPLTVLDVTAADNSTQKVKDTVVDKTMQLFENGFN